MIDWTRLLILCQDRMRQTSDGKKCARMILLRQWIALRIRRRLASEAAMRQIIWTVWIGEHDEHGVDQDSVVRDILAAGDRAAKEIL